MITSRGNERVKWVRRLMRQRSLRRRDLAFVVEGSHWLREADQADHPVRLILHREPLPEDLGRIVSRFQDSGTDVFSVSEEVLLHCVDTKTPSGVLAVLDMIEPSPAQDASLTLVVDGLSDPGNMGTILRTAVAADVEQIMLLPNTVDPYNPKVLRAAVGAHLHVPILWADVPGLPSMLNGVRLIAAQARSGDPYDQVDWRPPVALVIGDEAHGIRAELLAQAGSSTHIPISDRSESLNAAIASAIILFEVSKQRRRT